MNIDAKIFYKILSNLGNLGKQYIENIIYRENNIWKINVIHCITYVTVRKWMIVSKYVKNSFEKIQHHWIQHHQNFRKLELVRSFLILIKDIIYKASLIPYLLFNDWILSLLRSETREKFLFSPILFNVTLDVLDISAKQEKERKTYQLE